jgi:hypothetical protein
MYVFRALSVDGGGDGGMNQAAVPIIKIDKT